MGGRITDLEHAKRDDDMLSYLFVDLAIFGEHEELSRKMQRDKFRVPNVNWEPQIDILRKVKAGEMSPSDAAAKLAKKAPIITLSNQKDLDKPHQKAHLLAHIGRYMEIWKPDCDFRLFITHRYMPRLAELRRMRLEKSQQSTPALTPQPESSQASASSLPSNGAGDGKARSETDSVSWEKPAPAKPLDLGVKATRDFKVHEYVKLYGSAADLTDDQDDEMRMDTSQLKADFSVLFNPTKNCFQIFMGPARFVNHDCNNNVELIRSGRNLCFKVVRPIKAGEEILTFYGEEYFGPNNENCRCYTCRQATRGGWSDLADEAELTRRAQGLRSTRSGRKYDEAQHGSLPGKEGAQKKAGRTNARSSTKKATQRSRKAAKGVTYSEPSSPEPAGKRRTAPAAKSRSEPTGKRRRQHSLYGEVEIASIRKRQKRGQTPPASANGSNSDLTDLEEQDSDLTDLDEDSDLTDLEDLGVDIDLNALALLSQSQRASNGHPSHSSGTNGLAGLSAEQATAEMLSVSMPVLEDAAMPSPLAVETPTLSAAGSPAPESSHLPKALSTNGSFTAKISSSLSNPATFPSS